MHWIIDVNFREQGMLNLFMMLYIRSFKGRFRIMHDGKIRRWKEGKRHNAFSKVCHLLYVRKDLVKKLLQNIQYQISYLSMFSAKFVLIACLDTLFSILCVTCVILCQLSVRVCPLTR